jgi:hypothetical protein
MINFILRYKVKIILLCGRDIRIILTAKYEIKKYQASDTYFLYYNHHSKYHTPAGAYVIKV